MQYCAGVRQRLEMAVTNLDQLNSTLHLLEEQADMHNRIDDIYLPIETLYEKLKWVSIIDDIYLPIETLYEKLKWVSIIDDIYLPIETLYEKLKWVSIIDDIYLPIETLFKKLKWVSIIDDIYLPIETLYEKLKWVFIIGDEDFTESPYWYNVCRWMSLLNFANFCVVRVWIDADCRCDVSSESMSCVCRALRWMRWTRCASSGPSWASSLPAWRTLFSRTAGRPSNRSSTSRSRSVEQRKRRRKIAFVFVP